MCRLKGPRTALEARARAEGEWREREERARGARYLRERADRTFSELGSADSAPAAAGGEGRDANAICEA